MYDRVAGRYDAQHRWLTAGSDESGRRALVEHAVSSGDRVLDCGGGTGSTALLAARRGGERARVVILDASPGMLAVARGRAAAAGVTERIETLRGDLHRLPFRDGGFDVALSTYSLCPAVEPTAGALELYRVVRPGGLVGIAHSAEPERPWLRALADLVERVVWRFPSISLGCRSIEVLPALEDEGAEVVFRRRLGVPLWPFLVFVARKPRGSAHA